MTPEVCVKIFEGNFPDMSGNSFLGAERQCQPGNEDPGKYIDEIKLDELKKVEDFQR
jgi:hypothetical protein